MSMNLDIDIGSDFNEGDSLINYLFSTNNCFRLLTISTRNLYFFLFLFNRLFLTNIFDFNCVVI